MASIFRYPDEGEVEFGELKNKQGLRLQTYTWNPPSTPVRGVVIGVHGIGSHCRWEFLRHSHFFPEEEGKPPEYFSPKYEGSWVEAINKTGLKFCGLDLQSYGLSQGVQNTKHYFLDFDELIEDVILFRDHVAEENPGLPIFLLGESLGGCICIRVCELVDKDKIAGGIFAAPMMSLEQLKKHPINRLLHPLVDCVSFMLPKIRVASKADNVFFPGEKKAFEADPLTEGEQPIRARVAAECLAIIEKTRADLAKIESPILIFHSTKDTMCDPEGSEHVYNDSSSSDKKLVMLDSGKSWHALLHETEKDMILAQVLEWLTKRIETKSSLAVQ